MGRERNHLKALSLSRIYQRGKRYYLYWATPLLNPKTGNRTKWHSLCHIKDGMLKARIEAEKIISHNFSRSQDGNMGAYLTAYLDYLLKRREKTKPEPIDELEMFLKRNEDLNITTNVLKKAFIEFNVSQVLPKHIAQFLDSKESTPRMAQVYRSFLLDFFKYACRKGWCHLNPVENIKVEPVEKRTVYLSHDDFIEVRKKILVGDNDQLIPTGQMVLAYVDLCYLTSQRTTEIRLLKWSQITAEGIYFKPTKTALSSKAEVIIPITPQIQHILDQVKNYYGVPSDYVIHTQKGACFSASGLRSAWKRALARAGLSGVTLKDMRSKSLTDAVASGFELEQVSIAAAHTQVKTTTGYIKIKETPISDVILEIPKGKK